MTIEVVHVPIDERRPLVNASAREPMTMARSLFVGSVLRHVRTMRGFHSNCYTKWKYSTKSEHQSSIGVVKNERAMCAVTNS